MQMSIYPVYLPSWFPKKDEMHENAKISVKYSSCLTCGKKVKWKKAWGHHSIPWGNGDIWCSKKCLRSTK